MNEYDRGIYTAPCYIVPIHFLDGHYLNAVPTMIKDAISAVIIADLRPFELDSCNGRSAGIDSRSGAIWENWVTICAPRCDDLTMVAADPFTLLNCEHLIVSDHFNSPTLLSGLHAGLFAARHDYMLAIYAGMPAIAPAMIDLLLGDIEPRFDAVVFEGRSGLQPMPAAYSKRSVKPLARQLSRGDHRIDNYLKQLRIHTIGENRWRAGAPEWEPFFRKIGNTRKPPWQTGVSDSTSTE